MAAASCRRCKTIRAFNSEAGVKALTLLRELFKEGCAIVLPEVKRAQWPNHSIRRAEGAVRHRLKRRPAVLRERHQESRPAISLHRQHVPASRPRKAKGGDIYGASWSVFNSSPEKQLAGRFLKYFTDTNNIAKWAQMTNYIATRKSASTIAIEQVRLTVGHDFPEAAVAYDNLYDMLQYGAIESPVAGYDPVRRLIVNMVNEVAIKGNGDPKAVLEEVVAQANEVLKENMPDRSDSFDQLVSFAGFTSVGCRPLRDVCARGSMNGVAPCGPAGRLCAACCLGRWG